MKTEQQAISTFNQSRSPTVSNWLITCRVWLKGDEVGIVYSRKKNQTETITEKLRGAYKIIKEISRTTKLIRAAV